MHPERAEEIALLALTHIAGSEELGPIFLGSTGATVEDLRNRAGEAGFLASVLEFLTMDDSWIVGFCDAAGVGYGEPMTARQVLAGVETHWT